MKTKEQWTSSIYPANGWFDIDIAEIWRYRDLIIMFVKRDFVAFYKQTILGPLWFILQPLFSTLIFTLVFGYVAKLPTNGMPPVLFYMSGIVVWNYFSSCLIKTADTFSGNAKIFGKVYFPRLVIPLSIVVTNMMTFTIQLVLFLSVCIYYYLQGVLLPTNVLWLLTVPVLVLQMGCLGLGCGIIISALTTKYRDLSLLVGFGVQLWMYATPVVYPSSLVPANLYFINRLNPMSAIVEVFRSAFLGGAMPLGQWGISWLITLGLLLLGVFLFSRVEKNFMDTV